MPCASNAVDYSGDLVVDSAVNECISYARGLFVEVGKWLASEYPECSEHDTGLPSEQN